jgi:hypothetical protein
MELRASPTTVAGPASDAARPSATTVISHWLVWPVPVKKMNRSATAPAERCVTITRSSVRSLR